MKTKYAVFALALLILALVGILPIGTVKANPMPRQDAPYSDDFSVKIEKHNTVLKDNNIALNFTVMHPEPYTSTYWWWHVPSLISVDIYIDGNLSIHHTSFLDVNTTTVYSNDNRQFTLKHFSDWINLPTVGKHTLNVTALFSIHYMSSSSPKVVSDIVNFTAEQQEPTPSLKPSLSTDLLSNSMLILAIASVIVILAIASVSLVYFKKHKPNTELDKKP